MKKLLLLILLLPATLKASDGKPIYQLTIVDSTLYADKFWQTPAGQAFWRTLEGQTVIRLMNDYRDKMTFQVK